ncbi:hypothetical protein DFJ63DRAFT_314923 [Scheffersomyces coipomensis]|uniref:uncharacterized protein n=1 Tax=Scheffersomyces coipomensis TaxID=1788519 RepID=UPI00315DA8AC
MSSKDSLRILTLSDIQGNFHAITELYNRELNQGRPIDVIIHTGNFGLWNNDTIDDYKDLNYLKQIVAFSDVLSSDLVEQLNDLSLISNNNNNNSNNNNSNGGGGSSSFNSSSHLDEFNQFKSKLLNSNGVISQFQLYLDGEFKFPCPIYTIFGPLDDPKIINKFHTKEYKIPNLFLVDHLHNYEIPTPLPTQPNIKLYGIGGTLKIHSLFDNGNLNYSSISGKVGELWISLIQVAELYLNVMKSSSIEQNLNLNSNFKNDNTINIFLSHAPVIKNPLLEHLAIITNADFTISQGLHFRYPVSGNGMSFVDTMGGSAGYIENYRSKFSRLRMVLGELWLIIKDEISDLLQSDDNVSNDKIRNLIELGLSLFDKIPISINDSIDKIVPLTLFSSDFDDNSSNDSYSSKKILKKINDYYFQAYYNLWHFNLCDHISKPKSTSNNEYNYMIFKLDSVGDFKLDYCSSQGFNFNFKVQNDATNENNYDGGIDDSYDTDFSDQFRKSNTESSSIPGVDIDEEDSNELGGEDDGFARTRNLINSSNRFYRGSSRGSNSGRGRGGGFGGSNRGNNSSRGSNTRGSYRGSKFRGGRGK